MPNVIYGGRRSTSTVGWVAHPDWHNRLPDNVPARQAPVSHFRPHRLTCHQLAVQNGVPLLGQKGAHGRVAGQQEHQAETETSELVLYCLLGATASPASTPDAPAHHSGGGEVYELGLVGPVHGLRELKHRGQAAMQSSTRACVGRRLGVAQRGQVALPL